MTDILCQWIPTGGRDRTIHQWFAPTVSRSSFCFGAPVLCTIGSGGKNRAVVAVSDASTPMELRFCIDDISQRDTVVYSIVFFSETTDALQTYTADVRIDTRSIPYDEAIMSVSDWWKTCGYTFPACPPAAEDALYSSWYNFHQAPQQQPLLADLRIAAETGFKTVILDDGWQFEGPSSGNYSECGEWKVAPGKFPDFQAFVQELHELGMKLMVWFTVPFLGENSPLRSRFEGKYLYYDKGCKAFVLDPRFPSVRSAIIDHYVRFLKEYEIDGFKLDFVDSFRSGDLASEYDPNCMDCLTVDAAVKKLMTEIVRRLDAVKPGLLYEYRQNYVGPDINRFGNMLRVGDCAYDAMINRCAIADLRLLNYPIAVHSDMLFWSKEESLELCARQLLNILFAVPQISVILQNSTPQQRNLLKHYLAYWTENRSLLLHGKFRAERPEMNYVSLSAENEEKRITVQYADQPYAFDGKAADVFHCGEGNGIVLENAADVTVEVVCLDCLGHTTATMDVSAGSIRRIPVPLAGVMRLRMQK